MLEASHFPTRCVRSGLSSTFHKTVVCCKCNTEDEYHSRKNLPDQVIAKKLRERGWIIAKRRCSDICPACLRNLPLSQKLATAFGKVTENGVSVIEPDEELNEEHEMQPSLKSVGNRLTIAPPHHPIQIVSKEQPLEKTVENDLASITTEIVKGLTVIGNELGDIRAAMELMVEQQTVFLTTMVSMLKPHVATTVEQTVQEPSETVKETVKTVRRNVRIDDGTAGVLSLYDRTGDRYIINVRLPNDALKKLGWNDRTPIILDIENRKIAMRKALFGENGKHPKIVNKASTTYQRSVKNFVNFSSQPFKFKIHSGQLEIDLSAIG